MSLSCFIFMFTLKRNEELKNLPAINDVFGVSVVVKQC